MVLTFGTPIIERVEELLNFFGVNSLELVYKVFDVQSTIAFRKHKAKMISQEALAAWMRKGELDSYGKNVEAFNEELLKAYLNEFKTMTALYQRYCYEPPFEAKKPHIRLIITRYKLASCGTW